MPAETKASLRKSRENLRLKLVEAEGKILAMSAHSPEALRCSECLGFYIDGYLCCCGHDSSIDSEDF